MTDRTTVRLGLIGAGRWGRNYIRTIQELDGVSLVRIGSKNPQTKLLVDGNCFVTDNWREVLNPDDVDGIVIATPAFLHGQMTREAVALGLPVLVEKPLTLDLDEALSLQQIVNKHKGFVLVDHTYLFHPAYRAIKELGAKTGSVKRICAKAGNRGPYRCDVTAIWDWGPHDIAMCLDLLNSNPKEVIARRLEARRTNRGYSENFFIRLTFPGDVIADIQVGTLMNKTRQFAIWYDKFALFFDDLAVYKLTIHPSDADFVDLKCSGEAVQISEELPLTNVVKTFMEAITVGARDAYSLNLGVRVVSVLSECEKSLN